MRDPHRGIYSAKQPSPKKNPQKVKTSKQKVATGGGERPPLHTFRCGREKEEAVIEHCFLAPASGPGPCRRQFGGMPEVFPFFLRDKILYSAGEKSKRCAHESNFGYLGRRIGRRKR